MCRGQANWCPPSIPARALAPPDEEDAETCMFPIGLERRTSTLVVPDVHPPDMGGGMRDALDGRTGTAPCPPCPPSLIHLSEPPRPYQISYAVFRLKKTKKNLIIYTICSFTYTIK